VNPRVHILGSDVWVLRKILLSFSDTQKLKKYVQVDCILLTLSFKNTACIYFIFLFCSKIFSIPFEVVSHTHLRHLHDRTVRYYCRWKL